MYIYSYVTTEGIRKKINQDALVLKIASFRGKEILLAAVCDGIGGLHGGENASSYVISEVSAWFEQEYPVLLQKAGGILEIRSALDRCLHRLNDQINAYGAQNGRTGTTFTSLLIDPHLQTIMAAHVGDTRLYKIYEDRSELVTADHSVVAEEVRRGILSEEAARFDKRQNQITNCIGAGESDRMYDYILQPPEDTCVYLLCSDGFRKMIDREEIQARLKPSANPDTETLHQNLSDLMQLNMERKETDNITAVAVKYVLGE